ncbi:hypothetical protein [Sphingobacterium prati]|uniref:hypothetical protein n=1 Tax=Sphingobacterium prati TaxID=2737006 RepID=UPI0015537C46|nr:hypothetical protein [Sphingobacterium prati]NPE45672.1 hypothetical protein [Sphingobacterium prati]
MKRYFTLLCLLFLTLTGHAQKAILTGTVKDSIAHLPVSFASIALIDAHGAVVDGNCRKPQPLTLFEVRVYLLQ